MCSAITVEGQYGEVRVKENGIEISYTIYQKEVAAAKMAKAILASEGLKGHDEARAGLEKECLGLLDVYNTPEKAAGLRHYLQENYGAIYEMDRARGFVNADGEAQPIMLPPPPALFGGAQAGAMGAAGAPIAAGVEMDGVLDALLFGVKAIKGYLKVLDIQDKIKEKIKEDRHQYTIIENPGLGGCILIPPEIPNKPLITPPVEQGPIILVTPPLDPEEVKKLNGPLITPPLDPEEVKKLNGPLVTPIPDPLPIIFEKRKGNEAETPIIPEDISDLSKYWNKRVTFRGNKVYQRDDWIDPKKVDGKGKTNLQNMKGGYAPHGPDGKPINLHHMTQGHHDGIAEVAESFHQKYNKILHINNPKETESGIKRGKFKYWKKQYWINRAKDFE